METPNILFILVEVIFIVKGGYCSGCGGTIFSASSTNNMRLTDGPFYNSTNILTAADCATLCLRVAGCSSFNFESTRTLCELNSVDSSTGTLASEPGVVFSDAHNWQGQALLGSCGNRPCGMTEMCVDKGQTYNCVTLT